jgi:hypothetical protein
MATGKITVVIVMMALQTSCCLPTPAPLNWFIQPKGLVANAGYHFQHLCDKG